MQNRTTDILRAGLLCVAIGAAGCQPADETRPDESPVGRIEVPGGAFTYGMTEEQFRDFLVGGLVNFPGMLESLHSNHTIPPEDRTLPTFYIDEFEVTNARFARFQADTGYRPDAGKDYLRHWDDNLPPEWAVDFPVTWVSQQDATAYCEWAGGRLPTEVEWEKAARGTSGQAFPWGDTVQEETTNAATEQLEPVGTRALDRSPYGAYDMGGNAAEMTSSMGGDEGAWQVVRGGSYTSPLRSTVAFRRQLGMKPGSRAEHVGFRCAYDRPASP